MEPETKLFLRYPAIKAAIKDLEEGQYIEEQDQNPNYILIQGRTKIVRINVMATIVHKEMRGTITNVLIDDGTAKITLRFFEENKAALDLEIGEVVLIIGRVRVYNQEKYIFPEIVKKINPLWLKLRSQELQKQEGDKERGERGTENKNPNHSNPQSIFNPASVRSTIASNAVLDLAKNKNGISIQIPILKAEEGIITEEIEENNPLLPFQKLSKLIAELDKGEGVLIEEILEKSLLDKTEELLEKMLENGDIFQNTPGKVRVL